MSLAPTEIPISERAAYLARVHIGVTTPLLAVCIAAFAGRLYQRVRPWKVGVDDYFITAGFILTVLDWALLIPEMITSPGPIPMTQVVSATRTTFLAIPVWGLAMTCIKISVALTLLRIRHSLPWKIFLFSIIGIQGAYGIGNTFFILLECQPLQAAWDPSYGPGHCLSQEAVRTASNTGAVINITTDFLLSLSPVTFLHKLNRPLREKVVVCFLMSMGILASICSVMKTVVVQSWGDPSLSKLDTWAIAVTICTWTALEQLLASLAACVPALKPVIQRFLGRLGISLTSRDSQSRPSWVRATGAGSFHASANMDSKNQSSTRDDEEFILDIVTDRTPAKSVEPPATPDPKSTDVEFFAEGSHGFTTPAEPPRSWARNSR